MSETLHAGCEAENATLVAAVTHSHGGEMTRVEQDC